MRASIVRYSYNAAPTASLTGLSEWVSDFLAHGCSATPHASQNPRAALQVRLRERRDRKCALYFNTGAGGFRSEHRNISLPLLNVESDCSRMRFASARARYGNGVGSDSGSPAHRDRHSRGP